MEKLREYFGFTCLMLGGGGVLNWTFIQAGVCDELSVVIAPVADGSSETPTLFETRGELGKDIPVTFNLKSADVLDEGTVWLRYQICNP